MKVAEQLKALEAVAVALGVRVAFDPMTGAVSGAGGLCRVRGEYRVIIDRRLRPPERANLLADALARFDTGEIEMHEATRALLAAVAARRSAPQQFAEHGVTLQ